jgi:hypothetical protein
MSKVITNWIYLFFGILLQMTLGNSTCNFQLLVTFDLKVFNNKMLLKIMIFFQPVFLKIIDLIFLMSPISSLQNKVCFNLAPLKFKAICYI